MKKIVLIFLTLILMISLAACDIDSLIPDNQDNIDQNIDDPDIDDPDIDNPDIDDPNIDDPDIDDPDIDDPIILEPIDQLDIYYINDLHGAILENDDQMGLANIGNLVLSKKAENPNETLFLSGGDILQGNVLSNYFYGASTIDILNDMQLDAFVLGNHEFDWGLDVITQYFIEDSESDVKANFPLLGANVFYAGTTERPEGVDAYTIIDKGDMKIGIIGVVGTDIESSIATSKIQPYYFDDATYWTTYYAEYLRTVENVDMVIAINHDSDDSYNQEISELENDSFVDVIFN
ncbi:MAG: metallophosphoesterase [Acholeplasmataceae bacterium]